jgi:hypothetical protein
MSQVNERTAMGNTATAGELDRIDALEDLYRLDASEAGSEGMPSEAEPAGMPSEDEPAGMPSEGEPAGMPSEGEPAGMPSEDEPAGMPSEDEPEGMPSELCARQVRAAAGRSAPQPHVLSEAGCDQALNVAAAGENAAGCGADLCAGQVASGN